MGVQAWGGMGSVKHIQKFLSPGIDLTALNPKYAMRRSKGRR